ncbi:MAG: hypothetical protein DMG87_21095 [Acidobacteria bacterium]|nr:MAG: hypothetical protein DMG87_21095 [Acidobacteriota bacterium]
MLVMLDFDRIDVYIRSLGWARGTFLTCLVLLVRHIVSFEEFLILVLTALAIETLSSSQGNRAK